MRQLIHTELRVLLRRAGIRQAEFARLAGVTSRQVNKWCQGDAAVPVWVAGYAAALARVSASTIKALTAEAAFRWHEALGVEANADLTTARQAMKAMALQYHPDQGGSDAAMIRVNAAWEEARNELRHR